MMRDLIAPALRAHGMKGSGQWYSIPSQDWWALLGFQKSRGNDAPELRFTVNLSVASKKAWAEARVGQEHWMPEKPSANTRYASAWWGSRIGLLLPAHQDKWWYLGRDTKAEELAAEVVDAIRDGALPAMLERMNVAST